MNRFFLFLLALCFLPLSACVDADEPTDVIDEADETDLIADDNDLMDGGYYTTWDADRDMRLTSTEFERGFDSDSWWDNWDLDDDTYLSEDEFNTAYSGYSWYTPTLYSDYDLDGDGLLTDDEWRDGLFTTWDTDRDTYLTADEYDMNDGLFDL